MKIPISITKSTNIEERLSKPLPLKPTSFLSEDPIIDDISSDHLIKLLDSWLINLNVPIQPWLNVLYKISIDILEKSLKSDNTGVARKASVIYLQTISANGPLESKFLSNVYHGTTLSNEEYSISLPVGGTIRIYGVDDNMDLTKTIFELTSSLVYLINSLYLELYVMRDSHVKAVITSKTQQQQLQSITMIKLASKNSNSHQSHENGSAHFLGWLKKLTPHMLTPEPHDEKINYGRLGLRRGLSIPTTNRKTNPLDSSPSLNKNDDESPRQYQSLKRQIENALISSSPNCYYPYPVLINRLDVEEDTLLEQKRTMMIFLNENNIYRAPISDSFVSQRRKSSLFSSFSYTKRKNDSSNSIKSGNAHVQLPQSIKAYYSVRVPELLADGKKGLEHLLLDLSTLKGFKQHQSITLGFTCHPIGCPDRPCLGPVMSKMDFFRYKSPSDTLTIFPRIDQSLGDTIRHWYNQSQSTCQLHIDEQAQFIPGLLVDTPSTLTTKESDSNRPTVLLDTKNSENSVSVLSTSYYTRSTPISRHQKPFHGCNQPLTDHVFSFTHGIARVQVYTNTEQMCLIENKNMIVTWISCSICEAATKPLFLSENAAIYSFAKYLELMFYSTKIAAPIPFCDHTLSDNINNKSKLVRCFSYNGITFKFIYEETTYYDLRLPRLQMAAAPIEKITFEAPRISVLTLNEWKHSSVESDIDLFFLTIRVHLDLLNHYTIAEKRRKFRAFAQNSVVVKQIQSESKALDFEIKSLSKRLDSDHSAMLSALEETHINELNDFRRYFAIQSDTILDYLMAWQETFCPEVTDSCTWEKPDYMEAKHIHCFPGSSVLVREDEPISIIAYTLSSNDYIQELLLDKEIDHRDGISSTKTVSIPSLSSTDETVTSSSRTADTSIPPSKNTNKTLPTPSPSPSPSNVIDGYYSSIERKYISPSTGATSETASFRTMITEVVKSSVAEVSIGNSRRIEDLKARLSPWTRRQEETKLENSEGDLERKLTERTIQPLNAALYQEETKEVKVASYFHKSEDIKTNKKIVSPHIKHKFVHEGIEFTCIVYYAYEFDLLRRQCDINELIIQSLSRSKLWSATGGKSKSAFYKTQDERFVIKEMVNAWNVAEKDAFLKFAPKYFDHIKKSVNEPSILAKVFGFFTIRMKNIYDRKSLLNLDVLVMEHLFFNQQIMKRFDFKGIQDRHAEENPKHQDNITLWDGDWLHGYRMKSPVYEQSKAIMEQAILSDTEFLSKCNIMDYSLLVGVDQNKHEITIGIVDFIGAYTWYKKIESKSKSTLQRGKEVTVVPPEQYKIRFCREVCDYFVPAPGKFDLVEPSKTLPSLLI